MTKMNLIVRDTDETIRPETTREILSGLKVLPNTKWITAGISSTITDGASAVVLMSEKKVKELKLQPLARIVANTGYRRRSQDHARRSHLCDPKGFEKGGY